MSMHPKALVKKLVIVLLALASLSLAGCSGSVGVGMSVGVPIGNSGYMRVGGGRWY
jgi:predicted small secreted protein